MINYIKKDITTVTVGIIAHGVNCQGVLNAGIGKAIRKKWPLIYQRYKASSTGKKMLGIPQPITIDDHLIVFNCYTQIFYGFGGRFADPKAICKSLLAVVQTAYLRILPVYMPRIGCGLGGLKWEKDVEPIVNELSERYPQVEINICDYP